jgi:hypothetical protein
MSYQMYASTNFCMCARTDQTVYQGQNSHFEHKQTHYNTNIVSSIENYIFY